MSCRWNTALIGGELASAVWAHSCGVSWVAIGGVLVITLTVGAVLIFKAAPVLTRRIDRRHTALLAHWQADAALVEAEVARRHYARHGVDISRDGDLPWQKAPTREWEREAA